MTKAKRRIYVGPFANGKLYYERDMSPIQEALFEDFTHKEELPGLRRIVFSNENGEIFAENLVALLKIGEKTGSDIQQWIRSNPGLFGMLVAGHLNSGQLVMDTGQEYLERIYGLQIDQCMPRCVADRFLCTLANIHGVTEAPEFFDVAINLETMVVDTKKSEHLGSARQKESSPPVEAAAEFLEGEMELVDGQFDVEPMLNNIRRFPADQAKELFEKLVADYPKSMDGKAL